jgi:hypothetical protein
VHEPASRVYRYLSISTGNFNLQNIGEVTIGFAVDRLWLNATNTTPEEVVLFHRDDETTEWQELETRQVASADLARQHFEANTSSFSIYAVGARDRPVMLDTIPISVPEPVVEAAVNVTQENITAKMPQEQSLAVEQPKEPKTFPTAVVIITVVGIGILGGGVIAFQRRGDIGAAMRKKQAPKQVLVQDEIVHEKPKDPQDSDVQTIIRALLEIPNVEQHDVEYVKLELGPRFSLSMVELAMVDIKKLHDYITAQRAKGMKDQLIAKALATQGWKPDIIDKIFKIIT